MKKYLLLLFIPFLASCSEYEFKKTEEFNLQPNALKSGTEVELIHFSGGPEDNKDAEFYYQYIVQPVGLDDTIRVLSKEWHNFDDLRKYGRVVFYFSDGYKNPNQIFHSMFVDSVENNTINAQMLVSKVCVHKQHAAFETYNFPTTMGSFVSETTEEESNIILEEL